MHINSTLDLQFEIATFGGLFGWKGEGELQGRYRDGEVSYLLGDIEKPINYAAKVLKMHKFTFTV